MRANTKKEHRMGRRFAIVIGVAAAGLMALGAQTAAAATYNTRLTINGPERGLIHGAVDAGGKKPCEDRRLVTLFKQRPGADRKLGADRSDPRGSGWGVRVPQAKHGWRVYATVSREEGDGFVCSGDRSPILTV
jgi:hypothetical protein